eukprot:scaffold7960_cov129-Isochrysis_galbana.AAC.5
MHGLGSVGPHVRAARASGGVKRRRRPAVNVPWLRGRASSPSGARVDHDDIHASLAQLGDARLVLWAGVDGGADQQALGRALGRVRVVPVLAKVLARDERHQLELAVDHGQLPLLGVCQDLVGLVEGAALLGHDEVVRHHGGHRRAAVQHKVVVPGGHDAQQAAAEDAVFGDGHSREAVLLLDQVDLVERGRGRQAEGVEDESVLEALHTLDLDALLCTASARRRRVGQSQGGGGSTLGRSHPRWCCCSG